MKKILIILTVVAVLVCSVFSVSAIEINGIDYFDFDDYSQYVVQGDSVHVTTTLPDWHVTRAMVGDTEYQYYYGSHVSFTIDTRMGAYAVLGSPFGINPSGGAPIPTSHILDLYKMPSSFVLSSKFTLSQQYIGSANWIPSSLYVYGYYFDSNGETIDSVPTVVTSHFENLVNGRLEQEVSFTWDSSAGVIPDNARGVAFAVAMEAEINVGSWQFDVQYHPFEMVFDVDDAFFNFKNQSIIRDDVSNINQTLDEIVNGDITPALPDGNGTIEDFEQIEQDIMGDAQQGLDQAEDFQENALDVLLQYFASFQVLKLIFNLFAEIPFFYGLLSIGIPLGLFCAFLNLGGLAFSRNDSKSVNSGKKNKGG